jgi:sigma-B regulation protein RsbQ
LANTAVILIHGWCCDPGSWREQIASLSPGRDLVVPNLMALRSPASIDGFAAAVTAIADRLPQQALALVGHSTGSPVALEVAIRLGRRCRLVLGVDTFTDAAFYGRCADDDIAAGLGAFRADFAGTMASMVAAIMAPGTSAKLLRRTAAQMQAADPAPELLALGTLLGWDIGDRWPARPCPAETINSAWLDDACQQVAGLTGLRVHPLDGVGHFPMLEAPARFNALARAILDRHLGPAGTT